MSWFKNALGVGPEKDPKDEEHIKHKLYEGSMEGAVSDVRDGLMKLMNYVINIQRPDGQRSFQKPGEQVVFELNNVTLGLLDEPETEVEAGDFQIVVRRIK